jgi:Fe2+ transport system protein FeoA
MPLTLREVSRGKRVRVVRIVAGRQLVHRLTALGLVPGTLVTVTRPRSPVVVTLRDTRIALGHSAAGAIEVEEADL